VRQRHGDGVAHRGPDGSAYADGNCAGDGDSGKLTVRVRVGLTLG
jgi:hypothetical protein